MPESYILRIFRGHPGHQYWEEFELPKRPFENITSALMEIQKSPINRQGEKVTPVVWEQGCLEEVCGSCSMLINGKPRQACTALVDKLLAESKNENNRITLAPFSKFPLVRDLIVDRSSMFENLKRARAWIESDGPYDRGPGPRVSQKKQEAIYALSKCMTCGCCIEACPQSNNRSRFIGPQIIGQVRLFNMHPLGKTQAHLRMPSMLEEGGVADCGNAQNCQKVCPRDVPLLDSIAAIGRDATLFALRKLFSLPDRD